MRVCPDTNSYHHHHQLCWMKSWPWCHQRTPLFVGGPLLAPVKEGGGGLTSERCWFNLANVRLCCLRSN